MLQSDLEHAALPTSFETESAGRRSGPPAFPSAVGLSVIGLYVAGTDVYKTRDSEADRAALKEMSSCRVLPLGVPGRRLVSQDDALDFDFSKARSCVEHALSVRDFDPLNPLAGTSVEEARS
jgi:hypothetical protein